MIRTAALLVALSLSACAAVAPVSAQTTPAAPVPSPYADPACPKLAEVTAILDKSHEAYVVLDVNNILSLSTETPAHIIVATVGQVVTLGYESAGCIIGPLGIAKILPKHDI